MPSSNAYAGLNGDRRYVTKPPAPSPATTLTISASPASSPANLRPDGPPIPICWDPR